MFDNALLDRLERYLRWKESKKFYAKKLNVTEEAVSKMLKILHERKMNKRREDKLNKKVKPVKFKEDTTKGTAEVTFDSQTEIRDINELILRCNIDTTTWEIVRYVQNFWGNRRDPHWQVKAWMTKKPKEQLLQDAFMGFLSVYTPAFVKSAPPEPELDKSFGCLIIDKQDAHHDRYDIYGRNDIQDRFDRIYNRLFYMVRQAQLSHNLEKIEYILGSDSFNSEWTGNTTKGTPQRNMTDYHDGFRKVCDHEIAVISMLLRSSADVHVIFVPGNHDEHSGWHLVNWLKCYFRNEDRIVIDDDESYRKYVSYGNTAMMFNHGDAIRNAKLAGIFPMEFREQWSRHKYFYAFTGDVHIETSENINSIKFYRVPSFSRTRDKWEDKHGYIDSVGEATAFLIDDQEGLVNIFKNYL